MIDSRRDSASPTRPAAVRAVLLLGILYCAVGILFGILAGQAASNEMRIVWRRAAWLVSAIAFGGHIVYDQVRLHGVPRVTALRVSLAAALGAFGLAVAANIHAQSVAADQRSPILVPSLAIWPVMTAVPAFVVGLVSATLLRRVRRHHV
jgi:hypothetical protein